MTDKQLQERLAFWQKALRLQDWRIKASFVDSDEMPDDGMGSCHVFRDGRMAVIAIQNPESFDPTGRFNKAFPEFYDPERVLLHEMLHIPLDGLFNEDEAEEHEHTAQEWAIESLAEALIGLARR